MIPTFFVFVDGFFFLSFSCLHVLFSFVFFLWSFLLFLAPGWVVLSVLPLFLSRTFSSFSFSCFLFLFFLSCSLIFLCTPFVPYLCYGVVCGADVVVVVVAAVACPFFVLIVPLAYFLRHCIYTSVSFFRYLVFYY